MLPVQFVVEGAVHALMFPGNALDLKAHACVKRDGSGVHGRCDATDRGTAEALHSLEECGVELASQTAFSMIWMDGDKMDVRLTRISLGHKAGQEADDPVVFLRRKACRQEMDKEYPRQQFC